VRNDLVCLGRSTLGRRGSTLGRRLTKAQLRPIPMAVSTTRVTVVTARTENTRAVAAHSSITSRPLRQLLHNLAAEAPDAATFSEAIPTSAHRLLVHLRQDADAAQQQEDHRHGGRHNSLGDADSGWRLARR